MSNNRETTTIEQRVAAAILERSTGEIEINGYCYQVAQPTIATLIRASEIISTLPAVPEDTPKEQVIYTVLRHAKDMRAVGELAAVLILGAKRADEPVWHGPVDDDYDRTWWRLRRRRKETEMTTMGRVLGREILYNVSPKTLFDCIVRRLSDMEVVDFFAVTTSLGAINLLRPTAEVESTTTASGRQS